MPHHIIIELPKGRLRVSGSLNGAHFSLAIQYRKDGGRYFSVGAALRKAANIQPGDTVYVNFRILDLQNVELPEAFELVLHQETEVRKIHRALKTASTQPVSNYLKAAKNMDVRLKNAIEKVQRSRVNPLIPQPNKKNKNK